MLNKLNATFTILNNGTDTDYKRIIITFYTYGVSIEWLQFVRRYINCSRYVAMDYIIGILNNHGYKITFNLPPEMPKSMFYNLKINIISCSEEPIYDYKHEIVNITYYLYVRIMGQERSYLQPLTKLENEYCRHDIQLLEKISNSSHTKPKKVICSGPVTTVIFEDGTKNQVRCSKDDEEYNDYEKAFMMAWLYQLVGKKNVRKVLKENQDIFDDSVEENPIAKALLSIRHINH